MGAFLRRLIALFRRRRLDRDLDDELAFHLAMRQEDQRRQGVTAAEADLTTRRQFGSVLRVKEQSRNAWLFAWLDSVGQDVRVSFRGLRRAPGFSVIAVPALALGIGASTAALQDHLVESVRPALPILMAAVILVLMNVCANVANMLLARSAAREREFAIRGALAAGRARMIRQLLTEGLVLSAVGGAAGIGVAWGGVALARSLTAIPLPALYGGSQILLPGIERVEIDAWALTFALLASAAGGLLFALLPTLDLARVRAVATKSQLIGTGITRSGKGLRYALTIGQLGLATVVLVGAGLLIRSFVKLANVELGYNPSSILTFELVLPEQLPEPRKLAVANELAMRLTALSSVQAAGFTSAAPLSVLNGGWAITSPAMTSGQLLGRPGLGPGASSVGPDYLRAMGVQLLEGRWLGAQHGLNEPPALLVNRTLARQFFGAQTPLGQSVKIGGRTWHVVGVVEDVRSKSLSLEPEPRAYLDQDRLVADAHDAGWDKLAAIPAPRFLSFAVRVDRDPLALTPEVRRAAGALEPLAAVDGAVAAVEVVSGALGRPRFYAVVMGLFAGLAVVIAALGIYGVVSFTVSRRTQEIGIRIALGATSAEVFGLLARDAGVMIGVGIAIGVGSAIAVTRYLQAMLFGVAPVDLPTFIAVPVLCGLVAAAASYVPARRATRVVPIVALRWE
jgi:putative ABC transport system permease protein